MDEPISKTGIVGATPEVKNTTHAITSSIDTYVTSDIKCVPVIARDIWDHMPAFYKAALTVMERNGRCVISEV